MFLFFLALLAFSACSKDRSKDRIRIGVLPDSCVLPLYSMTSVEVVPFMSARERDTALQAGELDGVMTDLVAVSLEALRGKPMKIVSLTESRFVIVGNSSFDENGTWTVGISEHTVIEYLVDRLAAGHAVEKVAIPKVPLRMEMLKQGKIPLVCITDAMAWPLLQDGFVILKDQRQSGIDAAVLAFTDTWLTASKNLLPGFCREWNRAVDDIKSDPDAYREQLVSLVRLPESAVRRYPMPEYRHITLPDPDAVTDVFDWYETKYGARPDLSYDDIVYR